MILTTVAYGDWYNDVAVDCLKHFENEFEIFVLTDKPDKFKYQTQYYDPRLFSYMDKVLWPFRLNYETGTDVMYIDAKYLHVTKDWVKTFKFKKGFSYYEHWVPEKPYFFTDIDDDINGYWRPTFEYFKKVGYDITKCKPIAEQFFVIKQIKDILTELEHIKPAIEYQSLFDTGYPGIGSGEGVALAYALDYNKIPMHRTEHPFKEMFKNRIE